jgi:hypothetical protein
VSVLQIGALAHSEAWQTESSRLMLVVYPFCSKDWSQTVQNLRWAKELDGHLPFRAILSHDDATKAEFVEQVQQAASDVYAETELFWYPAPLKTSWPAAPNWAWQNAARYMAALHKEPWLWLEADCIPIRKGWLTDIAAEHARCGKAFSGHRVEGMYHMSGCCVYPPVVAEYSIAALQTEEAAWDVVLGKDIQEHMHAAHTLFQHSWCINPADGKAWNGSGAVPTFNSPHDVVRLVDTTMALFHRNKDGTLIEQLRRFYAHPEEAFVPQHTNTAPAVEVVGAEAKANGEDNREAIDPANSQTNGVGIGHSSGEVGDGSKGIVHGAIEPFTGKCEILIVTYHKDAEWLKLALATLRRHASGFEGITLCLPKRDRDAFAWLNSFDTGHKVNVRLYDEKPGKGMIQHMAIMASADKMVPEGTTHVLHMDGDCMVKEAITPSEYFHGTKPVYVIRSYAGLYDPIRKVMSDCAQWKAPTEAQLGFETDTYSMCRHPTGFPIEFYAPYRAHVEKVQGREFFEYMLSGRNAHPQDRMDFTAFGAWAFKFMHDRFEWINVDTQPAPKDKMKPYWSHGGITSDIQKEVDSFLA